MTSRPHGGVLAHLAADGRRLGPAAGGVGGVSQEAEGGQGAVGDEEGVTRDHEATHVLVQVGVDVGAGREAALLAPDVDGAAGYRHVLGTLWRRHVTGLVAMSTCSRTNGGGT